MQTRHHATLWVLALLGAEANAVPMFVELADLPGGLNSSVAFAVSGDGSAVVGLSEDDSGRRAVRWTAGGSQVEALGEIGSTARDASGDGTTVVGYAPLSGDAEALVWSGGGVQALGDLPGGRSTSQAYGISNDGQVIVGASDSDNTSEFFISEAFRWDPENGMQGLGDLPGGSFGSSANAVSGDGSVIVGGGTILGGSEAFRWDAVNGMQGLGHLPGGIPSSEAYAVSANGEFIVGRSHGANPGVEAFLWEASTGMQPLGDLDGGEFRSEAYGVSNHGVVVGVGSSGDGFEAMIWDPSHGLRELDEVLVGYGIDLTGWKLTNAYGISDDGRTIVGRAVKVSNGYEQGFLAIIPEPVSGLLLGLGLACLAGWRRARR